MAFADNGCEDFKNMSIYNLRSFLIARGITVSDSNKNNLVNLAQAAQGWAYLQMLNFMMMS